uniref:Chitin-binding type-2 domain-containing protein n=1 Tax=Caenorhabditis tropicalis TaxID=1561998 RepID=A0A1I7TNY6_9PELO
MILFCFLFLLGAGNAVSQMFPSNFCLNGDQRTHENPQKFWKCVNGKWTVETCQINYFYDDQVKFCVLIRPRPTISPPSHRICRPGERLEYIFDNTKYRECTFDGKGFIVRFCQPGAVFVPSLSMCVNVQPSTTYRPPTTTTRYPTATTPYYGTCTESGGRSGYKADIFNCRNFYQCASGIWTQRSCGEGTVWNQEILTCDHNRGQCRPHHPPTYPPTHPTWNPTYPPPTKYPNNFKK